MNAITPNPTPSLYDRMIAAGVPTDNHESDLYVPASPEALAVLRQYDADCVAAEITPPIQKRFVSQVDARVWVEILFHFQPWWDARKAAKP